MRKIVCALLVAMVMLNCVTAYAAADLPIDINAIGRQEGYDDAITTRFNIELFTKETQKANAAIAERSQLERDAAAAELFGATQTGRTIDIREQLTGTAVELELFIGSVTFSNPSKAKNTAVLPVWLMILLFAVCAGCGFVWALVSSTRKRRRKADVHYSNG